MHIYFVGIGGAGLGPMAQLCLDSGWQVSGSDQSESLLTKELAARSVEVSFDQTGQYMKEVHQKNPIDWVIYTAGLDPNSSNHPELNLAKELNIKMTKRHDFLNYFIKEMKLSLVAVSGTHGKTTTTAMLVWLLKQLKFPVSYLIGSSISFGKSAQYDPQSQYFVYEADEFDKNFLNFNPDFTLITSVDFDHSDSYKSPDEYLSSFAKFISQTKKLTLGWDKDLSLLPGLETESDVYSFDPKDKDNEYYLSQITLSGEHNRFNGFLAISLISYLTRSDSAKLNNFLSEFPGTNRRFELLKTGLYSDYAHHPSEIEAVVQMAREIMLKSDDFQDKKLVVVYQPHQNLRQHETLIQLGYRSCFDEVDELYWLPTFLSREKEGLEILPPDFLSKLVEIGPKPKVVELDGELAKSINANLQVGNMVVLMGAGSIDGWARKNLL